MKRYRLIVFSLAFVILIGVFIQSRFFGIQAAWYNNSWNYRQPVTVTYSGATLTNTDVLISFDTSTLISAGKMQANCDDLRLTDSDQTTLVNYWVESGCNTTTTQIWARIPSLPNGGKTIYLYYSNSSATNAEQSWTGNFIMIGNTTCPTGWTREINFDSKFPYGSVSVGTTGGTANHTQSTLSTNTDTFSAANGTAAGTDCYSNTHYHSATVTVNAASNVLPPYVDMLYCSKANLDIGTSLISLFNASAPTGWTRFTSLDNKFPRGNSSAGATGGVSTHTHSFNGGTTSGPSSAPCTANGWANWGDPELSGPTHTHTFSGSTTGSGDNTPPFYSVVYASKNNAGVGSSGMVTLATDIPPLGWTRFTSLNNRFPLGSSSVGTTGGASTHTHSIYATTSGSTGLNPAASGGNNFSLSSHTHAISGDSTGSSLPPYYTILFIQRNSPVPTTSTGSEIHRNDPPTTPILVSPLDTATDQEAFPSLKTISTDPDSDFIQYKINLCLDSTLSIGCTTFDQTISNLGWSGQNVGTSAYSTGTTATYILQTSLTPNTTYFWRSYGIDPAGANVWGNTQSTPFSFTTINVNPSGNCRLLEATNDSSLTLIWSDNATNETGYEVQRSVNSAAWSVLQTGLGVGTSSLVDSSVSQGNTYAYRVAPYRNSLYAPWCTTTQLSLQSGNFNFNGLNLDGLKIN